MINAIQTILLTESLNYLLENKLSSNSHTENVNINVQSMLYVNPLYPPLQLEVK